MGKVTVFCLLSGCTPEIAHDLPYHEFDNTYSGFDFDEEDEDYDGHGTLGTLLKSTLIALADAHELASQNDLTVIGPIHPSGEPFSDNGSADAPGGPSAAIARLNPQQDIRSISHCVMGEYWDFGSISAPPESDIIYLVSFGFCIMVQTYALDIMNVATHGRMTPLRVWKLAMQQGFLAPHNECGFKDVDYGEIELAREQFPLPVWLSKYQLKKVEELDDIELKQLVVHDGKFWIWMAPDRFPLTPTPSDPPSPALPRSYEANPQVLAPIERLPPEILEQIVCISTLSGVINLASTSQFHRTRILRDERLSRLWLKTAAPWWVPVPTQTPRIREATHDTPSTSSTSPAEPATREVDGGAEKPPLDWAYIRRCTQSGSMRNRRRIWHLVLDVERVADLAGV